MTYRQIQSHAGGGGTDPVVQPCQLGRVDQLIERVAQELDNKPRVHGSFGGRVGARTQNVDIHHCLGRPETHVKHMPQTACGLVHDQRWRRGLVALGHHVQVARDKGVGRWQRERCVDGVPIPGRSPRVWQGAAAKGGAVHSLPVRGLPSYRLGRPHHPYILRGERRQRGSHCIPVKLGRHVVGCAQEVDLRVEVHVVREQ